MSEKENQKTFVDLLSVWVCVCMSFSSVDSIASFFPSRFLLYCWANFLLLSLAVGFVDCGRGGLVRFECSNPSDFRIEADGVVYAVRSIQHSMPPALTLLIKASDTTTQQQWVTQVKLTPSTLPSQQVNIP